MEDFLDWFLYGNQYKKGSLLFIKLPFLNSCM
jgi:hypothetical protein